mmetsp:Transcript_62356/g.188172  ORF Transcript_62356/g.188172 Transcript_62356/m.188172 type:complete len:330 (+) Transcript_62356:461-1450(+)
MPRLPPVYPLRRPTGCRAAAPVRLQGRAHAESRWCGLGALPHKRVRLRPEPLLPQPHTRAARRRVRGEGAAARLGGARRAALLPGLPWPCGRARLLPLRQRPAWGGRGGLPVERGLRPRRTAELPSHRHRELPVEHRAPPGADDPGPRLRPQPDRPAVWAVPCVHAGVQLQLRPARAPSLQGARPPHGLRSAAVRARHAHEQDTGTPGARGLRPPRLGGRGRGPRGGAPGPPRGAPALPAPEPAAGQVHPLGQGRAGAPAAGPQRAGRALAGAGCPALGRQRGPCGRRQRARGSARCRAPAGGSGAGAAQGRRLRGDPRCRPRAWPPVR